MAKEEKQDEQEGKKGGASTMKIVIVAVLIAVLLSGILVGAALYFYSDADSEKAANAELDAEGGEDGEGDGEDGTKKMAPPQYHSMGSKFVVSFRDKRTARFMQFSVEIMVRDKAVIEHIETHSPAVRSNLLMLFDNQQYDLMQTREGKNQLLKDIAADINATLAAIVGADKMESKVEAAYFTEFVIQ